MKESIWIVQNRDINDELAVHHDDSFKNITTCPRTNVSSISVTINNIDAVLLSEMYRPLAYSRHGIPSHKLGALKNVIDIFRRTFSG